MLSKKDFYDKIVEKYDRKLSIDFWFEILYFAYEKEKITEEEILELLDKVNKNQT